MKPSFYQDLAETSLNGELLSPDTAAQLLTDPDIELIKLLDAAFTVRKHHCGMDVTLHIINNAQNGFCPEDCHYCPQAKTAEADIADYPMKSDEEILKEAQSAYEKGAFRYCMVFAGRGPSSTRVKRLANLVKEIKSRYPLEICVSPGLLGVDAAQELKAAGLDRLNHNLNTSEKHYPDICTTHTYQDRLNTLKAARSADIQVCSGMIVGMGETSEDILDVAYRLREIEAESIPVNFLIPVEGNIVKNKTELSPQYCLKVLSLFRFLNPKAEIRAAAGREGHLRSMEVLCLYPANSIFLDGYLNTKGGDQRRVLQMIRDAGFNIKSDQNIDDLLAEETPGKGFSVDGSRSFMKTLSDLRPFQQN